MNYKNSKIFTGIINGNEKIKELYMVLKNNEEQYSLWPDYKEIPVGWNIVFGPTPKENCINYIKENWIDMRTLSLRKKMTQIKLENKDSNKSND